jgi:hypothetical protein
MLQPGIEKNVRSVALSARLEFEKTWIDDDLMQLNIAVCDSMSTVANKVYVGHQDMKKGRRQRSDAMPDFRAGATGPIYPVPGRNERWARNGCGIGRN